MLFKRSMGDKKKVLLIGVGNFGKQHLQAWLNLGYRDHLFICEKNTEKHKDLYALGFPQDKVSCNFETLLPFVDICDIVTDTNSHFEIAKIALQKRKNIFVEKPLTLLSTQAKQLNQLAQQQNCLLQVGYYYRYHPLSLKLKSLMNEIEDVRYVRAEFYGFKRARTDVGVMHSDGIHFLDLANWLFEDLPEHVTGFTRDHFKRDLEDLAVGHFFYKNKAVLNLEAGYIQPGQWKDKVVAQAMTTKQLSVVGSRGSITVDFESEVIELHRCQHVERSGVWHVNYQGSEKFIVDSANTISLLCTELADFLDTCTHKREARVNAQESGVYLGQIMEAYYEASRSHVPVQIHYDRSIE